MSALNPEQHNTIRNEVALEIDTPILFEIVTSVRLTRIRLVFSSIISAGFAENVTEDALRNKFSVFGKIRSVRITRMDTQNNIVVMDSLHLMIQRVQKKL